VSSVASTQRTVARLCQTGVMGGRHDAHPSGADLARRGTPVVLAVPQTCNQVAFGLRFAQG